ncbi:dentin sialophosphoprotein-like [Corythoichthys intestinalis]|uniref:dentin sialophosphoprotein-like n=1 Tax=Corythoichthys intestinalis TaxID=161448 RepID=UPI0025A4D7AD|nr:dentin sialophosphoprotein-like [Corythoichthys intestinalis]
MQSTGSLFNFGNTNRVPRHSQTCAWIGSLPSRPVTPSLAGVQVEREAGLRSSIKAFHILRSTPKVELGRPEKLMLRGAQTQTKMLTRSFTLLALFALVTLGVGAPLSGRSAPLLAHLDGKVATRAVTSPAAPVQSRGTSRSPGADDSRERARAQVNNEDVDKVEGEGASDSLDSDGTAAEIPDLSLRESQESPDLAGSIKSTESTESAETPESVKSAESPESAESSDAIASEKSRESAESADSVKSPESAETNESAESPKSAESPEPADSSESPEPTDSSESPEPADSSESAASPELPLSPEQTEESSSEAEDGSEKAGGAADPPMGDFDLMAGGQLGPEVLDEEDAREGSQIPETDSFDRPDLMEGGEIGEEGEKSPEVDGGSDASVGVENAELGGDALAGDEQNVPEAEESSQIFDSTEAPLVQKSASTPSSPRE